MKKLILIVISILIIIPALLPLLNEGFFAVHDNTQVERVFQMKKSLQDGHFPVRWVEDLGYGYGYPIFNFYAPLPYYFGGVISLIISNSLIATKIMFAVGTVLSFFTMYWFASRFTNIYGGIAAGVIYLYFPYHAVNIYVRGAVGEFFAYAFMPLVFWAIYYIDKNLNSKEKFKLQILKTVLLSTPIALVVISHNLSAFMMGIFLIPYIIFFLFKAKRKKEFLLLIFTLFTSAFLLSAFYILPAVFESQLTNVSSQIEGGAVYYDNFVCLIQLWYSQWGFGGSIPGCTDGLSFSLGRINIFLIGIAFLMFVYSYIKTRKTTNEIIFWVLLVFSVLIMLPLSKLFWDIVPFTEYLQYPWRFLNFAGLFISLLVAFLLLKIKDKNIIIFILFLVIGGQLYFNVKLFKPVDSNTLSNSYFENIEHIRWETSKISDEYMPEGFSKPESSDDVPKDLVGPSTGSLVVTNHKTGYIELLYSGPAGKLVINKAYFPSWNAYVNGSVTEIKKEEKGMSIDVSEGKSNIVLKISSTPIQILGNILTAIGIVLILAVIIVKKKKLYE